LANRGGKVEGIPTPDGASQGIQQREYMDSAYPGTTPWERLGVGQAGQSVASSAISAQSQQALQKREMINQNVMQMRELAARQSINAAQLRTQAMGYGSIGGTQGAKAMLDLHDGVSPSADPVGEKVASETQRNEFGSWNPFVSFGKGIMGNNFLKGVPRPSHDRTLPPVHPFWSDKTKYLTPKDQLKLKLRKS